MLWMFCLFIDDLMATLAVPGNIKRRLSALLRKNEKLFPSSLAELPGIRCPPFEIHLLPGAKPRSVKMRRWSPTERAAIKTELDVMSAAGIIEP